MTTSENSTVRRVITAQAKDGKNIVAIDERVDPIVVGPLGYDGAGSDAGQQLWPIWGADGIPQLPDDAGGSFARTLFAPPGGYRLHICEFPAEGAEPRAAQGEWPATGVKSARVEGGLHHTDSVDLMIVLEGEIGLEHDEGVEVILRAGDVLVQNGAAHRWKRRGVPCRICMVAQGAVRAENAPS